jgi:outer membrane autotransporter protein
MTISGVVSTSNGGNATCFQKNGLGTLNLSGNATLANGTCVKQGTLLANAGLTSNVTVDAGAKLGGAGVINGTVAVQGTLAPGNSPGFLQATNTVTMLAGSNFQASIAGTTQANGATPVGAYGFYSTFNVAGNKQFVIAPDVTLAPALKNIYSANEEGFTKPSFVPTIGQTFRIITAEGGISGRFTSLIQPEGLAVGTRFALFYNTFGSNSVDLKILPSSFAQWLSGGNATANSMGSALDKILATNQVTNQATNQAGGATTAQDQLLYIASSKSENELPGFIKSLTGEVHGALAAVQPLAGQWLQGVVARRMFSMGSDSGIDLNPGNAVWVDVASNKARWSADDFASGFSSKRTQFAFGGDVFTQRDKHVGIGISHANTNVSINTGSGDVEETMAFVYGQASYGSYSIDGLAGYGTTTTSSQRLDPLASGSVFSTHQKGHNVLVSAGIRRNSIGGESMFEPFARVMMQQAHRSAVNEGSAITALSLDGSSMTGVRALVGINGHTKNKDPLAASNTYNFSLAAGMDTGGQIHTNSSASIVGIPTLISSPKVGRAFVQADVSGTARINRQTYAYASITGEARQGKSEVGVNVGVRIRF